MADENPVNVDGIEGEAPAEASVVNGSDEGVEQEAELIVKTVEVLGQGAPPVLTTEEPSANEGEGSTNAAVGPHDDRTEDQVTEILEDEKLLVKMANLSGPSLDDVANLPEDERAALSVAEDLSAAVQNGEAPVGGAMKQLEIQLDDQAAALSVGESIPVESVSDVKTEIEESVTAASEVQLEAVSAAIAQGELLLPEQTPEVSEATAISDAKPSEEPSAVSVEAESVEKKSSIPNGERRRSSMKLLEDLERKISDIRKSSIGSNHGIIEETEVLKKTSVSSKAGDDASRKISQNKLIELKPTVEDSSIAEKKSSVAAKPEEDQVTSPVKKTSSARLGSDESTRKISQNKLIELTPTIEDSSVATKKSSVTTAAKPEEDQVTSPVKKVSATRFGSDEARKISQNKLIELKPTVENAEEDLAVLKKTSVTTAAAEEPLPSSPVKKVSAAPYQSVADESTRKISQTNKLIELKPSVEETPAAAVVVPEEPPVEEKVEKKTSVVAKKSSRQGSLTNKMIELTPTVEAPPETPVEEKPAEPEPEAPKSPVEKEPPKKKTSRFDKPEPDKASKFGGRAKRSAKEDESKDTAEPVVEAPKKSSVVKKTSAVKEPEAVVVEPAKEEAPIAEPEAAAPEPAPEAAAPEPVPEAAAEETPVEEIKKVSITASEAPKQEEIEEAVRKPSARFADAPKQEAEEEVVRKPSARRVSPPADEQEKSSAPPKRDYQSKVSIGATAASSYVPSSYSSTTGSGGRYTSQTSSASKTADYLPFYRHTPSYVNTFDSLVSISSFSQNLYPVERSRSRSKIRRKRYESSPIRDYSSPASLDRGGYGGISRYSASPVSRSTSSSSLMGYVDAKNYELRRDHSRSQIQDSYPLIRSNTTRIYGPSPAEAISNWYHMQEHNVDQFVHRVHEPLPSFRSYASYYQPAYSRGYAHDRPEPHYSGTSSYGVRPYYPSYDSRPFISGLRASRFDPHESRYFPSLYQPSYSRGFALTSGPLMTRSGFW